MACFKLKQQQQQQNEQTIHANQKTKTMNKKSHKELLRKLLNPLDCSWYLIVDV